MVLFRAYDTGQLSSSDVDWTWQWSTNDVNRVDQCLVLCCSANCNFWCLVPANVAAAVRITEASSVFWHQISCVLHAPAVRTLCSCWNHGNCWSTLHVAEGTRRWLMMKWITAIVDPGEYVVATIYVVFHSSDWSMIWISTAVSFPLWIFRQTQRVAAAATLGREPSCCVSYEHNNIVVWHRNCLLAIIAKFSYTNFKLFNVE